MARGVVPLLQPMCRDRYTFLASATQSPTGLKSVLADLQSRLSLLTTFKLPAWELDDFERLLGHLAHDRGLLLSDDVARYLTMRIQRRPLDAVNVIATIDESTLVEKRSPTIPFLKLLRSLNVDAALIRLRQFRQVRVEGSHEV